MPTDLRKARELFLHAVGKLPAEQWEGYVAEACGEDAELAQQVECLLQVHREAGSFLNAPAPGLEHPESSTALYSGLSESPGTVIGPYKLLQQIGEGGMGVVFMAEQTEPIQRTVALKIIKPGMDTRQVIARFEAERQALAMMDHPNIAKVMDAGTTDSGRPYFVMELVKGVPITNYCDEKQLSLGERLELFTQVCHAVQQAHQKGIIHRDIKPSNVIVAEYDNHAVPKVIDFGVAKATAQKLTERTIFTEFGQVVGTVEYMSPEQAKLNQLDIDTRSDIYSLGVLLYELLTGTTPFERTRLQEAAFDEMLRIIREEEPPKPSTKLSTIDTLPSVAANRHAEPGRLTKDVHGELDWIVMKALEKDRNRRYETANAFAADIERHLRDEPVQAGPPSAVYRFRKFARRNRVAVAAGALVAMSILVALGGIASGIGWAVRDRAAREEQLAQEQAARQARVTGQLEVILEEVALLEKEEKWDEALIAARRAEPALVAGEAAPDIQERGRQALTDLELVERIEEIRAESGTVWGSANSAVSTRQQLALRAEKDYAAAFRDAQIDIDVLPAEVAAKRIIARAEISAAVLPALDDWVAVRSIGKDESATRRLANVLRTADPDPWRQRMRDALARRDWPALHSLASSPDVDRQPAATLTFLTAAIQQQGEAVEEKFVRTGERGDAPAFAGFDIEIELLRRAQRQYPADYWINHRLGTSLIWRRSPHLVAEGIGYMRAAVALRPYSSHAMSNLGNGYVFLRQHDQAVACFRKALELNPDGWVFHNNLGLALSRKGAHEEAIAALEQAIKLKAEHATEAYSELAMLLNNSPHAHFRNSRRAAELAAKAIEIEPYVSNHWTALGMARYRESQWQEARTALERSLELGTNGTGGALRWADAFDWFFLAMSYWQLGQQDLAQEHYDRAVQGMGAGPIGLSDDELLLHIQAEAEELLKIADERGATNAVDPRGEADAFAELGTLRVRQGNFRQAVADYAKAMALGPASEIVWVQSGSLLAHLRYREAFRKQCAAMLERFGDTQNRNVAERTAKLMSSVPTDFSGMDPLRIVALADRAVASGSPHQDIQWFHLAKGMADYRAGHFDSVVLSMQKARTPHWPVRTVLADLYMAMAQFQLGDREASVKTLDGAVSMLMTLPQPGLDDLGEHFHDYLFCQLARREAEALILNPAREPTTSKEHNDRADEVND